MDIASRVKEIRKRKGLSQAAFGKCLGVSRDVINNIENSRVELSEVMLKAICGEFSINESWLRTGNGEVFAEDDNVLLSQLSRQYNLDAFSRRFIETYIKLSEPQRDVIKKFAYAVAAGGNEDSEIGREILPPSNGGHPLTEPEIESEVESYRQELEQEKSTQTSSASPDTGEDAV